VTRLSELLDWIPAHDPPGLSNNAEIGLVYARAIKSETFRNVFELAYRRGVSETSVRRRIARAKLELARADRRCEFDGEPIAPSRRAGTRYCGDACKTAASRARRR